MKWLFRSRIAIATWAPPSGSRLGCLKIRILGIFIFPVFDPIDYAGIYSLVKS